MQEAEAGRLIRFDVNGSQRGSEGQESFLLGCFPLSCSLSLISFARSANMQSSVVSILEFHFGLP